MSVFNRSLLISISICVSVFSTTVQAEKQCPAPDQKTKESIVLIEAGDSIGSGIVISENQILTAAHVVKDATHVVIKIGDQLIPATVISKHKKSDLALIQTTRLPIKPIHFATEKRLKHEWVWAMGYPMGQSQISASGRYKGTWLNSVYTSASVNYGQSGGGLIACEQGQHVLAGMVRAFAATKIDGKLVRRDDLSVATGINQIRNFLTSNQLAMSSTNQ
ncbi:MAG TPA: hypothetical protein DD827_05220 [Gammaproteobacteria bacterium]|nr:hypothetical protein [Gammaproteobacteria bacterium]